MLRQQFKCTFSGQQKVTSNEAKTVCEWRGAHACGSVSSQRTTANSCTLLHDEPPPCFDVLLVPCCPQFLQISSSSDKLEQKRHKLAKSVCRPRPQGSVPPHIQGGSTTSAHRVGSASKIGHVFVVSVLSCVCSDTYIKIFLKKIFIHTYMFRCTSSGCSVLFFRVGTAHQHESRHPLHLKIVRMTNLVM